MSDEPVAKRTRRGLEEIPSVELQVAYILQDCFKNDKERFKNEIVCLNKNINKQSLKHRAMLDLVINYDISALVDVVNSV